MISASWLGNITLNYIIKDSEFSIGELKLGPWDLLLCHIYKHLAMFFCIYNNYNLLDFFVTFISPHHREQTEGVFVCFLFRC